MKWILGIDGGGTKTTAYAGDVEGNVIGKLAADSSNYHIIGLSNLKNLFLSILENMCSTYKLDKNELEIISLGLAGAGGEDDKKLIYDCLISTELNCKFIIRTDAEIALMAGILKLEGIVLISGTGSIAYGINNNGDVIRAGGLGHIIGDEGSGYYIAREGLRRGFRSIENMDIPSILLEEILKSLNFTNINQLKRYVYSQDTTKKQIAELAVVVANCAANKDELANKILLDAGKALLELVQSVINRGFNSNEKVEVVLYGSILKNIAAIREYIISGLRGKASVVISDREPAYGAVLIGIQHLKKGI